MLCPELQIFNFLLGRRYQWPEEEQCILFGCERKAIAPKCPKCAKQLCRACYKQVIAVRNACPPCRAPYNLRPRRHAQTSDNDSDSDNDERSESGDAEQPISEPAPVSEQAIHDIGIDVPIQTAFDRFNHQQNQFMLEYLQSQSDVFRHVLQTQS
jgi:hypothetical protein